MILADVIPLLVICGLILLLVLLALLWAWLFWRRIEHEATAYYAEHEPITRWQSRHLAGDAGWQKMIAEVEQEAEQHTQEYDDNGPLAS